MDLIKNGLNAISNTSGIATAAGGSSLWMNEHWQFLNENAAAIGVVCTVLTFLVFLASKGFEAVLKWREHKQRLK